MSETTKTPKTETSKKETPNVPNDTFSIQQFSVFKGEFKGITKELVFPFFVKGVDFDTDLETSTTSTDEKEQKEAKLEKEQLINFLGKCRFTIKTAPNLELYKEITAKETLIEIPMQRLISNKLKSLTEAQEKENEKLQKEGKAIKHKLEKTNVIGEKYYSIENAQKKIKKHIEEQNKELMQKNMIENKITMEIVPNEDKDGVELIMFDIPFHIYIYFIM